MPRGTKGVTEGTAWLALVPPRWRYSVDHRPGLKLPFSLGDPASAMAVIPPGRPRLPMHAAFGAPHLLCRPCVDCGLYTGNFCDHCQAVDRTPAEEWVPGQHTPLCTKCDWLFASCHFCRGVHMVRPFAWGNDASARAGTDAGSARTAAANGHLGNRAG